MNSLSIPFDVQTLIREIDEDVPMDSMTIVRAWSARMSARYGPRVWDQEERQWIDWEQALTKRIYGKSRDWLLDCPVFSTEDANKALEWEFGHWWPTWCVKAHLVSVRPCEFEDHKWRLIVDHNGTRLTCDNPCEDPRIYCDEAHRYVYPACQNIPDCDNFKFEIEVSPEWVYHSEDDWWVELNGEVLQEKPDWVKEKHPEWFMS